MRRMLKTSKVGVSLCLALLLGLTGCAQSSYSYKQKDISDSLDQAAKLLEEGKNEDALEQYLQAMEAEPKSMEARLGAVQAEIALSDFESATRDLSMAALVDPTRTELYELYLDIARISGDVGYAHEATALAKKYHQTSFLERLPQAPKASLDSGVYGEKRTVELSSSDKNATIMYRLSNHTKGLVSEYHVYDGPITLTRGSISLEAYVLSDSVTSESITREYQLSWTPEPVTFADPIIEDIVRYTLGKTNDQLTDEDLENVLYLRQSALPNSGYYYNERLGSSYVTDNGTTYTLSTLDDIKMMPNLVGIYMNKQEITDFSALKNCPYFTNLEWVNGKLKNLNFVRDCPGLASLYVTYNEIKDVSGITGASKLENLAIGHNQVKDASPISSCKLLSSLYIDAGLVGSVDYPRQLTSLSILGSDFDRSAIQRVSRLEDLTIFVSDASDQLSDLGFLEELHNLYALRMYGVADSSELTHLYPLSSLRTLYLLNSSATDDDQAMRELSDALPNCSIVTE